MIAVFYGTRPEYLKIKPIVEEMKLQSIPYRLFKVGQHESLIENFEYDEFIQIEGRLQEPGERLNDIVRSILGNTLFIDRHVYSHVLVQGDTTTAFAVALAAFNRRIPVMHVEAGLRTYSKQDPYPEEVNRQMISSLAQIHFCPTITDKQNLMKEGYTADAIFVTGNTSIDNIADIEVGESQEVIVTMHRRENIKSTVDWFAAIEEVAQKHPELQFVFPMHPSPHVQQHREIFEKVKVEDPWQHDKMKSRLASCKAVITDSGGIQEETCFLKKPTLVCRRVTERQNDYSFLVFSPSRLQLLFEEAITNLPVSPYNLKFGKGDAAVKIVHSIREIINA